MASSGAEDSDGDEESVQASSDEESDHSSTPVKGRRGHTSSKKVGKKLTTAKMTAAQRAKQAGVLQRRKARVAARLTSKHTLLKMPTINHRLHCAPETDPWARARQILHVSATPEWLPCREEEFAELEAALEDSIDESSGCCLYISGVPGTGKTATVHSVINCLQTKVNRGELHKFNFFEINGMKVTEPSQAFVLFWEFLVRQETGETVHRKYSPREALSNLEHHFNSPCPTRETW